MGVWTHTGSVEFTRSSSEDGGDPREKPPISSLYHGDGLFRRALIDRASMPSQQTPDRSRANASRDAANGDTTGHHQAVTATS